MDNVPAMADVMVTAFEDDPNVKYQFSHATDPKELRCILHRLFMDEIRAGKPFNGMYAAMGEGGVIGGCLTVPSGNLDSWSFNNTLRFVRKFVRHPMPLRTVARLLKTNSWTARKRAEIMGDRDYLYLFAVGASERGKGVGGAHMRHITGIADALGWPMYLENSKQRNLPFYERYGFKTVEAVPVNGAVGAPTLWLMVREAEVRSGR